MIILEKAVGSTKYTKGPKFQEVGSIWGFTRRVKCRRIQNGVEPLNFVHFVYFVDPLNCRI